MINKWLNFAQSKLYPPSCHLCGADGWGTLDLCAGCLTALPWNKPACQHCALPLPVAAGTVCGHCLSKPPPWHTAVSPLRYEFPVNILIQKLKYQHRLALTGVFGRLLASRLARLETRPDAIIPVPLHRQRLTERGFNQAIELARPVAARLRLPLRLDIVERMRKTTPQSGLRASERRSNLRRAFRVFEGRVPAHIALLDDVMTTGATVAEITRCLKAAGAARIDVWTVARAG